MHPEDMAKQMQILIDRQAILDCLYRYSRGVDRCDREMLKSVYHEDAWDDHAVFCGPAGEFADWVFDSQEKYHKAHHHYILNHMCDLDGDRAHTETYYLFAAVNRMGPATVLSGGRYIDRFEKRDGRWAIAARRCLIEWTGTLNDVHFEPDHIAALQSAGVAARGRDDTSYDRPLTVTRPRQIFPY